MLSPPLDTAETGMTTACASATIATARKEEEQLAMLAVALCTHEPNTPRECVARLLAKCQTKELRGPVYNRRRAAVLVGYERAIANPSSSASREAGREGQPPPQLGSDGLRSESGEGRAAVPPRFFTTVTEALRLGSRFSMCRLLELQHSGTRRH